MNQPAEMNEHWRMFIAVNTPETVKAEIEKAQEEIRRGLRDARIGWTRREQFHLTLKFLGDVDAARVPALTEVLNGVCKGFGAMNLRSEGVGCFPDLRYPRVIWVGVKDEQDQLARLVEKIGTAVSDFTEEKREEWFSGHITLGRVKDINRLTNDKLARLAQAMAQKSFGQWRAETIELMRSELSPQGARHTELSKFQLV
jgi:2'-5' RNA ligase